MNRRVECAEKHDGIKIGLPVNNAAFDELEAVHQVELERFTNEGATRMPFHIERVLVTGPVQPL